MADHDPRPDEDPSGRPFPSLRRRREKRESARRAWGLIVLLLLLAGAGIWLWLRSGSGEPEDTTPVSETTELPRPAPVDSPSARAETPPLELPELEASDSVVREVAAGLSERPRWAAWLVTDDLVHRFVASVVSVSTGSSPAGHVEFLAPDEAFDAREADGRTVIDPASYRRYDLLAETFASVDTERTARLYDQLHPLFEEAHRELGFEEGTFDDALARAIRNVLAVQVPDRPPEVEPDEGVYVFRDPALEARSPAAKHLLRMGPENARRVQAKLRELADAIGLEATGPASR